MAVTFPQVDKPAWLTGGGDAWDDGPAGVLLLTDFFTTEELPPVTGTIDAVVPRVTAALTGQSVNTGTLAASVPRVTASITGTFYVGGTLAAVVPRLTADLVGASTNAGVLDETLPLVTGDLAGDLTNPAVLDATLPVVTGDLAGVFVIEGTLNAVLPLLRRGEPPIAYTYTASLGPRDFTANLDAPTMTVVLSQRNLAASVVREWKASIT